MQKETFVSRWNILFAAYVTSFVVYLFTLHRSHRQPCTCAPTLSSSEIQGSVTQTKPTLCYHFPSHQSYVVGVSGQVTWIGWASACIGVSYGSSRAAESINKNLRQEPSKSGECAGSIWEYRDEGRDRKFRKPSIQLEAKKTKDRKTKTRKSGILHHIATAHWIIFATPAVNRPGQYKERKRQRHRKKVCQSR